MSTQYPGGLIPKRPVTPSGPYLSDTASGIWTLDQQAYWAKLGSWPTAGNYPKDAQFNYVTMLLHGDGTNGAQNNTFIDSSTNNFTITRNGNTTQGSFSPYGSNWSNAFNLVSTPDYLDIASNAAFGMGTGDYTIESWFYCTDTGGYQPIIDCRASSPVTGQILFRVYATGQFYFSIEGTGTVLTSPANIATNTWVHAAVVKASGVYKLYINGTSVATASNSVSIPTSPVRIGNDQQNGNNFKGYLSNLRIVKGTAVYTSNFTPSTTPLTAVSGTSLLTCQSNRFIDNSASPLTITVNNAPSVQRFNPFGTSTAYSTSVIGGSGYFDGTGDYLTASATNIANFGTADFIVSAWFNSSTTTGNQKIFDNYNGNNNSNPALILNLGGAGTANWYAGQTAVITSSSTYIPNTWNYVVVSRVSSTTKMFLNGTQVGSVSDTRTYAAGYTTVGIGGEPYSSGGAPFPGYITDLQVVKGSGVTSSTVPTAPVSASGTTLALSFQNGAIFDNAMMNDLETVGNAQISTSVKKYGTGSMYFDGSGDYLASPPTPNLTYGTGNFTIEAWVYLTTTGTIRPIVECRSGGGSTAGYAFLVDENNYLNVYSNGFKGTSSSTITGSSWTHVALVRAGTGTNQTTYYINGTASGTITLSGNLTDANTNQTIVGNSLSSGGQFNGYIDDLRITNGYARYTSTFTPPTAAFPDIGPT